MSGVYKQLKPEEGEEASYLIRNGVNVLSVYGPTEDMDEFYLSVLINKSGGSYLSIEDLGVVLDDMGFDVSIVERKKA